MKRSDPVSLRLPDDLKASIQAAAKASGRSVNAEIKLRLEASFEEERSARSKLALQRVLAAKLSDAPDPLQTQIDDLRQRLEALEKEQLQPSGKRPV